MEAAAKFEVAFPRLGRYGAGVQTDGMQESLACWKRVSEQCSDTILTGLSLSL